MNRAHEKSPWRVFQRLVCRFNKVVDSGNRFPGAVVYDVAGRGAFPFGRKYAIMLTVLCLMDTNVRGSSFLRKGAMI
jgi:hypothetical protein